MIRFHIVIFYLYRVENKLASKGEELEKERRKRKQMESELSTQKEKYQKLEDQLTQQMVGMFGVCEMAKVLVRKWQGTFATFSTGLLNNAPAAGVFGPPRLGPLMVCSMVQTQARP